MTCIVLVQNPDGHEILPITSGEEGNVARFGSFDEAKHAIREQPLVKAWGGYVVDLDNLEVTEI